MGRGVKIIINRSKKKRDSKKEHGSDDSDEDYVLDEDQESNASEGLCASADNPSEESFGLVDDDDDDDVSFEEEEEQVEKKRVGRSKPCKLRNDDDDDSLEKKRTRVRQPSKRARVSDDEEEDYEFDDDVDDEEFMPDEIDCVDEEEDLQVKEKTNKVKKCISRKKVSVTRRKRKRNTKVMKKPMKKKPRRFVVRKSESSDDDFIVSPKVVPEISKKKTKIRTKKMGIDWDSDSDCSEPPDLEYTISEEEKELLKEANTFCGNLKPCLRNSSMSNRLHVDVEPNCQQQLKPIGRKGKSKVSDLQNDSGKQVCGICLSEEGKETVRGTLNCCSHYFCFSCIMEWSKVESRCPLCKQRFLRITKPAKSNLGIDLRNAVVQVPKRDQVYRPSEEEVRGYFDPYENVVCIECHQGGDDSLMLLCDICDSPAHTYCVGLGQEVPEGNWFCKGCRDTETISNLVDPVLDHGRIDFGFANDLSTRRVSAEGIESIDSPAQHTVSVPEPSFSQLFENFPSPRYPILEDVHAASPSGIGASTLSGRRRVYRHMHDIRSSNRAERFSRTPTMETSFQHGGTFISNGLHTVFESREQDADSCFLEDEELVSARFNCLRRLTPGSNTAIASTSFATSCPELERTNVISVSEQFPPCSSRPFIRSDDSISPNTFRESSFIHGEGAT